MTNTSDQTLRQLDALNSWLSDVYGEDTSVSTLLNTAGFSEVEIDQLKQEHLVALLQAVLDLLETYADLPNESRNELMVLHYGLSDGKPQNLYHMGSSRGVCGERMRQLVNQRLNLYHDPDRQAQLHVDFAAIVRRLLLDDESDSKV